MFKGVGLVCLVTLCACGSAVDRTPVDTPPQDHKQDRKQATSAAAKPATEKSEATGLPKKCEEKDNLCLPPASFVKRLCSGFHPDIALILLGKATPFSRAYLTANVEAWNASGGASSHDKLAFDEEVLVLQQRKSTSGIQVSGASEGGFDVLRWDGTCASLSSQEITFKAPPRAKTAKVAFKDLADDTQNVLLENEKISKINAERRKECKGVTMGSVSAKCAKLVDQLSETIVEYVREGGSVPEPAKLP